ncbi:MAG: radical SAM protein [Deltaproteobacteria bacterium]|nr:radical SAM protein [Deltaproteobacteria bacterium]
MNVLLLQLDGSLPNIALMRLAAHHRERGDRVELRRAGNEAAVERQLWDEHDCVYASLLFERTRPVAERLLRAHPQAIVGGTGWDLRSNLEQLGVGLTQDYSIYPSFRSSIGFLQRGCRFKCPFCVVPKKEGPIRQEQTVEQLWRGPEHPKHLIVLDNDFFGNPAWPDRIAEIREGRFRVNFCQGINARCLDERTAAAIASVDYRDARMQQRRIYTAWDNRRDEERLFRGLRLLVDAGVKPNHIMVYILIGYWAGETHEDRDHRRHKLREFGARPYPMPYTRRPELVAFQRWVVQGYDKAIPWETFWAEARGEPRRLQIRPTPQLRLPTIGPDNAFE